MMDGMTTKIAEVRQKLSNVEHQLETAKIEVTKPFPQESELKEKMDRLTMLNALLNMNEKGGSEMVMEDSSEKDMQEIQNKERVAETSVYPTYASCVDLQKSERVLETSGKEVYGVASNGRISIKEKLAQMKEKVSVPKAPERKEVKRNKGMDCL